MSRPRLFAVGKFSVATWSFEVATWGRLPGRVATSARPACARPALAVRVTCERPIGYVRSRANDLDTARVMYARPGFLVCALCTQPNFVTVHCLGSRFGYCSWTRFKNSLVYDLIYEIFIWKLI